MTPAQAIGSLDRQIARHGQHVALRRGAGSQHNARGFVRGYKTDELVGLVSQADRLVILSPTTLGTFGVPEPQDDASIAGRIGKVQEDVNPIYMDDVLVRIELRVRLA